MKFAALIATSMCRGDLLINRALKSVFGQTRQPDIIVVVDDNEDERESQKIKQSLSDLSEVVYLKNAHTHCMSGTGAWNTGIEYIADSLGKDTFVAILDDDDEWYSNHLEVCESTYDRNSDIIGIFPWIYRTDLSRSLEFTRDDLTVENFLIGDPGIQGSNMVIRASAFMEIGLFDETLQACTDRDIMIRLIKKYRPEYFIVIPKVTVHHYASQISVTYDRTKKHKGLDLFYTKYLNIFPSIEAFQRSIERANRLFNYCNTNLESVFMNRNIIAISVAMHNNAMTISRCLTSIACQEDVRSHVKVIVGNDASNDSSRAIAETFKPRMDIEILDFNYRNVAKTRNAINDYISRIHGVSFIGRLDADDEYASKQVLSKIESIFDKTNADVVIGGNGYIIDGKVADFGNWQNEKLTDVEYLRSRVKGMSEGKPEAELPSCNVFVKPSAIIEYPDKRSAEDHYLTIKYLAYKSLYKTIVTDEVIVTNYTLGGIVTRSNKENGDYIKTRRKMPGILEGFILDNSRIQTAKDKLNQLGIINLSYLGLGQEGVVFHDENKVYKVFVPIVFYNNQIWRTQHLLHFKRDVFKDSHHFYIVDFLSDEVISYEYEPSEPCLNYSIEDAISFLTECWRYKIIIKDCKPNNFVRVHGTIKLIDMKGYDYDDNLFLNMAARMFLYAQYGYQRSIVEMRKLTRSAIDNFEIPELSDGVFREFVNRVYANIIFEESKGVAFQRENKGAIVESYTFESLPNLDKLYFSKLKEGLVMNDVTFSEVKLSQQNYFLPDRIDVGYSHLKPLSEKVSMLIKCCAQDAPTLKENVKHIVRQLYVPEPFFEIVLGIDSYTGRFLRQYNKHKDLSAILKIAQELLDENVIDRYVVFPDTENQNRELNGRWFNLDCKFSHTEDLKPVTPQLYALESCEGDYILQMDCDVMIGRKDVFHCFLSEMIEQLKHNNSVISVGFNIPNFESKPYYGFENGGFVPEVRLGMFDKKRLLDARPLPNALDANEKLTLSWFRALEQKQRLSGLCSIRGGNKNTFFIHPQNYRKSFPTGWMPILDRVEQGHIPLCQFGEFDCAGSLMEWCGPKRNEEVVVVSVFRNVAFDRFLRFWASLMSQTDKEFGIILYDDLSDNGLPLFIDSLIKGYEDRVTFVKGRYRATRMENEYTCIHNYMSNQQSAIVLIDGDDALIGCDVIKEIHDRYKYWGCDVVIGRYHQTYRIQPSYRYPADFQNPRRNGGNVWQHTKSFKKYLFDSIPIGYFSHDQSRQWKWKREGWFETVDDYAIMVPIVELSEKPIQMDIVNYFYERSYNHRNDDREIKEKCIGEILSKPALKTGDYFIGRKSFMPAFDKIELDITHDCNLKCHGCNRSCGLAPTKESMTISQIKQFIGESIELGIKWTLINVLGGEPTLHKDFLQIIKALKEDYKDNFSPETVIQIVSNGYTEESRRLCETAKMKYGVIIDYGSFKVSNKVDYFTPFNDAPIDHPEYADSDYSKGCWVAKYCGINLNHNGYFACSVCGANDRVLGGHRGAQYLRDLTEDKIKKQLYEYCRYCGNFKEYDENYGDNIIRCEKRPYKEIVSSSWQTIYKKYNSKREKDENK
ncbi:MAG: glycosyltransferase [Prevotellaceae bacterium]|nr:glycosyltransferase [Candidatus Faecinaster equi]